MTCATHLGMAAAVWCSAAACCAIGTLAADDAAAELQFAGARAETFKTIGDVTLRLHIFEPAGHQASDRRPAIVFFFGGGWKSGTPTQFEQQCRYLAGRGMVAITADYRVSSRHQTQAKECVQDGKSAIRWVRTNAARLGVDPDRIAAGGGSAGGHVAACTAVLSGWEEPGEAADVSAQPNLLVLFNPALALAPFEGMKPRPEARTADLAERIGTDPVNLSPAHQVRAGVPATIIFFGTDDDLLDGAKFFEQRMQAAGNACQLVTYDGERHGFFNFGRGDGSKFRATLEAADRFLATHGYLQGSPMVDAFTPTPSKAAAGDRPAARRRAADPQR